MNYKLNTLIWKNLNIIFDTYVYELIEAVDNDRVERIILNLLSISIKFSHMTGKIFVNIIYDLKNIFAHF